MSILYKFQDGKVIPPDEIAEAVKTSFKQKGVQVMPPTLTEIEGDRDLGIVVYDETNYHILLLDKTYRKGEPDTQLLPFDKLGVDEINGFLRLTQPTNRLEDHLMCIPTEKKIEFLRGIANEFKGNLPQLELVAIAYHPIGKDLIGQKLSYERV